MNVLVINCGSSSLKFQLIRMEDEYVLAKGLCERIGINGSKFKFKPFDKEEIVTATPIKNHGVAIELIINALVDDDIGVIDSLEDISAIGHRVLHGGTKYRDSAIINEDVKDVIRHHIELGPLHNPANLIGIDACEKNMPGVPNVAVFDTAYGATLPPKAYLYALPREYYDKYHVRRFGFHGTSHRYVATKTREFLGLDDNNSKVIVCHLGNGSSISATLNGECVDTSMGLTPLEGLPMGTRSGDLDPAILEYICRREKKSVQDMLYVLNNKSGVFGASGGLSSDFRDLRAAMERGDKLATETLEMFTYRLAKYIGSYTAAMNGVDAITFTAGIGENAPWVRSMTCEYLGFLGVEIDEAANEAAIGKDSIISTPDSKVTVSVLSTNEELAIARYAKKVVLEQ